MAIFPKRERLKAGKYLGVCLTVSVPSAVFVVEAVKKTLLTHGVFLLWQLRSWTLDACYHTLFMKVHVKPVTAFSLCHATPDGVNTRPFICFPCTWQFPSPTPLQSWDLPTAREIQRSLKKQWLTETPLLSSDAPPMCSCFAAALFGSQEVPGSEWEVAHCAILWQNVSTETGGYSYLSLPKRITHLHDICLYF